MYDRDVKNEEKITRAEFIEVKTNYLRLKSIHLGLLADKHFRSKH